MSRRKRKYFVDIPDAQSFIMLAYGLKSRVVNFYHLKIWHEDFKGVFNWYHTQGTLVVVTPDYSKNIGHAGEAEEVAIIISKYVSSKL